MISVCILTKNASSTLKATLDSVRTFPEVILLDNGSTDQTLPLARTYPNVHIYETPFIGFGPLRNKAAELATHDWILSLDSDEVLSPPLLKELTQLTLDPSFAYLYCRLNSSGVPASRRSTDRPRGRRQFGRVRGVSSSRSWNPRPFGP